MAPDSRTGFTINYSDLLNRYGISQSTLSHRIKQLQLKTRRVGRNTYLTLNQLAQLDELDKFLKENPRSTIKEYLIYSTNSYRPTFNGGLDSATESELIDKSADDSISIHPSMTGKNQALDNATQQILNEYRQLLEHQRNTIEEQQRLISEQRRTLNDYSRIIDTLKLEQEEILTEVEEQAEAIEEMKNAIAGLKHNKRTYKVHSHQWQEFWQEIFGADWKRNVIAVSGRIAVCTNLYDNERGLCGATNTINSKLPGFVE